jgi:hypothetical protein
LVEFEAYITQWQHDVAEFLGPQFETPQESPPPFNFYLKPPASGPHTDFIFTLAENIDAVIQSIDAYLGTGQALIGLARRRKEREDPNDEKSGICDRPTYLYTTVRGIETMCLYHAYHTYYKPDNHPKIELQATTRDTWNGSVVHPTPGVQYTIGIRIGQSHYLYIVTADARPVEHFMIRDGAVEGLELPDWFGERKDRDPYSPTEVPALF